MTVSKSNRIKSDFPNQGEPAHDGNFDLGGRTRARRQNQSVAVFYINIGISVPVAGPLRFCRGGGGRRGEDPGRPGFLVCRGGENP